MSAHKHMLVLMLLQNLYFALLLVFIGCFLDAPQSAGCRRRGETQEKALF